MKNGRRNGKTKKERKAGRETEDEGGAGGDTSTEIAEGRAKGREAGERDAAEGYRWLRFARCRDQQRVARMFYSATSCWKRGATRQGWVCPSRGSRDRERRRLYESILTLKQLKSVRFASDFQQPQFIWGL